MYLLRLSPPLALAIALLLGFGRPAHGQYCGATSFLGSTDSTDSSVTASLLRDATAPSRGSRPSPSPSGADSPARYIAIGAAVDAAAGLTVGLISKNGSSECEACLPPTSLIAVAGAVVGAIVGTVGGLIVYAGRDRTERHHRRSVAN